jgi:hypothetical protein
MDWAWCLEIDNLVTFAAGTLEVNDNLVAEENSDTFNNMFNPITRAMQCVLSKRERQLRGSILGKAIFNGHDGLSTQKVSSKISQA